MGTNNLLVTFSYRSLIISFFFNFIIYKLSFDQPMSTAPYWFPHVIFRVSDLLLELSG